MRIGELAAATGLTTKTLRFYEHSELLPVAARTANGYRDYDRSTVARIEFIRRGQSAGLTLAELRQILAIRDGGLPPCDHVRVLLAVRIARIDSTIAELTRLRATLTRLHDQASQADPDTCPPDQICRYL